MPDIRHDFPINASPATVFEAVTSAKGLNSWWTQTCKGAPVQGSVYLLGFGPGYDWRAEVASCAPDKSIEWVMTEADQDWTGTRVSVQLESHEWGTLVRFAHEGWPQDNAHWRSSSFCWAMYLRLLKRYVELGEVEPYNVRLDV